MGRMTLEPSNQYHEGTGSFVIKDLPLRSNVTALVSLGFMRQDEPLVPFSTNTVDILSSPAIPPSTRPIPPGSRALRPGRPSTRRRRTCAGRAARSARFI